MNRKMEEAKLESNKNPKSPQMTRKEALKKSGYFVISAATTMILLSNPNRAQAQSSPAPPPAW